MEVLGPIKTPSFSVIFLPDNFTPSDIVIFLPNFILSHFIFADLDILFFFRKHFKICSFVFFFHWIFVLLGKINNLLYTTRKVKRLRFFVPWSRFNW